MSTDGPIERIVVGLDGSSGSAYALEWAIQLARNLNAEVVAVHAWSPSHHREMLRDDPQVAREEARTLFEERWCAPLARARIRYRPVFVEGYPVATLTEVGLRERAAMIVVGARDLSRFRELLLGSVSQQLAGHSPTPVVVVPSPPAPLTQLEKQAYRVGAQHATGGGRDATRN